MTTEEIQAKVQESQRVQSAAAAMVEAMLRKEGVVR